MDEKSSYELYLIKAELQSIINELYSIRNGLRTEFSGIGNDICTNAVSKAIENYEYAKRKLNSINTTELSQEFKERLGKGE